VILLKYKVEEIG